MNLDFIPHEILYVALLLLAVDKVIKIFKDRGVDFLKLGKDTVDIKERLSNHLASSKINDEQTAEMYKWHDVDDPNSPGTKIWWLSPAFTKLVLELNDSINELGKLLQRINENQKDICRKLDNK